MRAPIQVLHASNHAVCFVKPAGMPSVPDDSGDESLLDRARAWVKVEYRKPGDVFLGVVHRLDRPVSGVVCFARTSKGAARLTESFRTKVARKTYIAIATGQLNGVSDAVEHWLVKDRERNVVRIGRESDAGAKLARTELRVVHRAGGQAVVELSPITGRPHQLRVALASLGAPILGDLKYGAPGALADRSIALHARKLWVPHPTSDEPIDCEAALPAAAHWDVARGR